MADTPLSAVAPDNWHRVDPRYVWLLRIHAALYHLALVVGLGVLHYLSPPWLTPAILALAVAVLGASLAFFTLVWAVRHARRLRYLLRERDINLQMGFLFWKQMSMSMNRIQHLEVNQGPLQRTLGLATLSAFSAGTHGSNLHLPGLPLHRAYAIKAELLHIINSETVEPADAD